MQPQQEEEDKPLTSSLVDRHETPKPIIDPVILDGDDEKDDEDKVVVGSAAAVAAVESSSGTTTQPPQRRPVVIDDEDDEDDEQAMQSPKSDLVAPSVPKSARRTLTDVQDEADQDQDDDDDEEDEAEPTGGASRKKNARSREDDDDDDDDDQDDDDEQDDDEGSDGERDRPRKKKRRRRAGGNQFLDIEADVDEDEDEEEDEGEEGFVANDDFIVNQRRAPRGGLLADGDNDDMGDLGEGEGDLDGDASHRLLDRRRMAKRDREAAELAASFRDRYGKSNYIGEGDAEWAPKALLMPGVNDPSIWGVKCKIGRERDLVMSISRKAAALAASDNAEPLEIISAMHRDSLKGFIYIEARSETAVRKACNGLLNIYINGVNGLFLIDIEEMPDLLKTKQKKPEINVGAWVRIKRGKHAGDLAQIIDFAENDEELVLKFIPRIDLTPKEDTLGSDGKKRKKGSGNVAFRPPQNFFNPDEIVKIYGGKEVSRKPGKLFVFRNEEYRNGYCEKLMRITGLTLEDVQPTIDEVTRFNDRKGGDGEVQAIDLSGVAESSGKSILQPGDHVDIIEGDQKGMYGTIETVLNDVITIAPHADLDLGDAKVEVPAKSVRKHFTPGDHIKVMAGSNVDETGMVVKVQDDIVTFLSDLSMQEVDVFTKDVREAAEVGSGVNNVGQFELHDLVQLSTENVGVIFKIERDMFRVLDQSRTVRLLKPSQISGKVSTFNAVATDHDGYDIKAGDEMKEATNVRDGLKGRVLHVYRGVFAFLYNREYAENGGVFVTYARSLVSTAPKAKTTRPGMGLNPDLFAVPAAPQATVNLSNRPDGRIHRRVAIAKGGLKGNVGVIKDVVGDQARVELHSQNKVVTIPLDSLREQLPDGSLKPGPLEERSSNGGGYGARPGYNGGGVGGARHGTATNTAPLGVPGAMGGRTPFPAFGGRTPAAQFAGGRTPAVQFAGGRTPAVGYGGATPFAAGRTPADPGFGNATPADGSGGGSSAFNPSARTPFHPGGGASVRVDGSDAFNASSRTPYHPGARDDGPGRATDPRGNRMPAYNAGGRTPAYGVRNNWRADADEPYAGAPTPGAYAGAPTPGVYHIPATPYGSAPTPAAYTGAPTPAPSGNYYDSESAQSAPTPAASKPHDYSSGYQAKTPYEAPTPYAGVPTPYAGAPTPAAGGYGSYSAPTPAAYGAAPTPAAYGVAPTPGGAYGAPTPGAGYQSYQTPGVYQGAATVAAQPLEYQPRHDLKQGLPSDWVVEGIQVIVTNSTFQENRLDGQHAIIKQTVNGLASVEIVSNGETVHRVPNSAFTPMEPDRPGETCLVLAGPHRGKKAVTQSRDGSEWMVAIAGAASTVIDSSILTIVE
ncbi:BQ2448_1800 [Microbotryum intermedium]|uniref:Transcription elongation factor SPT5 n=1 Tax=Microbotryum intermedium TaxID=269621 RepID=A0A238FH83_9BASI|nr:BQ2448_1800 [Microbotryum intermedium]